MKNYDETIINMADNLIKNNNYYNMTNIKDLILNKKGIRLYDNYSEISIICRLGLENYIIKNDKTKDKNLKENIDYIKDKVLKGFIKNPVKYCDSLLLKEENITNIYSITDIKIIKESKKKYLEKIYNIIEKDQTNEKEKHALMKYLNMHIDIKDRMQNKYVKEIIDKGVIPSDTEESRFFYNFLTKKYNHLYPNIYSAKLINKKVRAYQYDNYIFINANEDKVSESIQLLFHELTYFEQRENMINNIQSTEVLEYSIRQLFTEKFGPSFYHNNYIYSKLEKDAKEKGKDMTRLILSDYGKQEESDKIRENELKKNKTFKLEYINYNNKPQPIENFTVKQLNEIISKHPEKLNKYKVLQNLYHKDGTAKSFEEIITSKEKKFTYGDNEIFYNHAINYISNGALEKLDIDKMPKTKQKDVLKNAELFLSILNNKLNKMTNINNLNKSQITEELYSKMYIHYVKLGTTLSEFLSLNIDKLPNDSALSSKDEVTYRINNLLNIIDSELNSKISIEPNMINKLNKYRQRVKKSQYDSYLYINRQRIKKEVNNRLNKNQKSRRVSYKSQNMTLEEYLINVVPHLLDNTSHSLIVHVNGRGIDIENYIEFLKENIVPKEEEKLPTYNELKKINASFDFKGTTATKDNPYGIEIVDNKTGEIVKDESLIKKAVFADLWRMAAGTSYHPNDTKPGDTIAFLPAGRETYKYICTLFQKEIEKHSYLNMLNLKEIALSDDNPRAAQIIIELLKHPGSAMLIEEYFKSQIVNKK